MYSLFYHDFSNSCCIADSIPSLEQAVEMAISLHRFSSHPHKVFVCDSDVKTLITFNLEDES